MKTIKIIILSLLTLLGVYQMANAQFKVVGYAASWAPTTIQYSKLTHINYSFALPQYGGRLKAVENPGYLQSIVTNAHANGVKVYIAIGGWSDAGAPLDPVFESIGADPASRANLVNDALYIINTYNLDGVDLDWEYPDAGNSANNFTALIRELSNVLRARGKGLSFASAADGYNSNGYQPEVFQYVDHVNIMAYDGTVANHSTYQFAVDGINLFKSKGCPANKCVIGVPFYARPSWRSFAQLVAAGADPNSDWFGSDGYNGIQTIKQKTQLALSQAGGIMIWELSQDAQGVNSLLSMINDVVKSSSNNNNNSGVTNISGSYQLQNRFSGQNLDVNAASSADGARIQQWPGNGCICQNFKFTHLGNGIYSITADHSGKSLDVSGISTSDGAPIVQWPYWGGDNQKFKVVSTGDGFYKLIAVNSGKLVEVGGWSNTPGGIVQQWADNNQSSGQWKLIPKAIVSSFSRTIQAEDYSNMAGVQKENTSDAGGGQNVGYVDTGDWMAYSNVNFPTSGTYKIEYRVASLNGGNRLSLDLNAGSIQLGAVNIPSTGGWQNWTTVSQTVNVNAGTYNLGIYAVTGGFNLNWIKITKINNARMEESENLASDIYAPESLEIFPNPVSEELNFSSVNNLEGGKARILDMFGNEVRQLNGNLAQINVSALKSGVYALELTTKDNIKIIKRFVKQ